MAKKTTRSSKAKTPPKAKAGAKKPGGAKSKPKAKAKPKSPAKARPKRRSAAPTRALAPELSVGDRVKTRVGNPPDEGAIIAVAPNGTYTVEFDKIINGRHVILSGLTDDDIEHVDYKTTAKARPKRRSAATARALTARLIEGDRVRVGNPPEEGVIIAVAPNGTYTVQFDNDGIIAGFPDGDIEKA